MSFGLNVAPAIMKAIVDTMSSKDESVRQATSSYIDDIYVDKSMISAARMKEHMAALV